MSKIAFVFPGQGTQKIRMGQDIAEKYPSAKAIYKEVDKELAFSLTDLITSGPLETLTKSENAQPAIVTTSLAILKVIEKANIKADYVAGHSLGEYSALVAGGFLSQKEAIYLTRKRGKLMESAVPNGKGSMAAVLGLKAEVMEEVLSEITTEKEPIQIANYNCPGQIVISGALTALNMAIPLLKEKGAKRVIPLAVSGPFHSELMKPAALKFKQELNNVTFTDGKIPIVSNVDASITTNQSELEDKLIKQIYSPVKWEQTIDILIKKDVDTFVEIGPGNILAGLIKKINRNVQILSVFDVDSVDKVIQILKEEKA